MCAGELEQTQQHYCCRQQCREGKTAQHLHSSGLPVPVQSSSVPCAASQHTSKRPTVPSKAFDSRTVAEGRGSGERRARSLVDASRRWSSKLWEWGRRAQSNPSNPARALRGGVSCYGHRPKSLERRISYADTALIFSGGVRVTPTPAARSRAASSYVNTASVGPKRVSVNATRTHTDLGGVPRRNAAPLPGLRRHRGASRTGVRT